MKKVSSFFSNNLNSNNGDLARLLNKVDLLEKRVIILENKAKGAKK
jgi:hypothetical protein